MSLKGGILSLNSLPDGGRLSADVCVVGSGAGGGILAASLAQAGINVLLLEMGSLDTGPPPDATIGEIDVSGEADIQFGRALQLGGSSNLWAGRIAPLEPIDFEVRGWVSNSGWPITSEDLAPFYQKAAKLLGVPPDPFRLEQAEFSLQALTASGVEMKPFRWARAPFNVARYLVDQAGKYPCLRILLDAPAIRLAWDGDAITHVEVRRSGGTVTPIYAEKFVVAAGGIETPRLLLNSRNASGMEIGNSYGLVGRYLSTHPKADIGVLLTKRTFSTKSPLFTEHDTPFGRARLGLGFSADVQQRQRLLNHYVQLSPLTEYRSSRLFEAIKGKGIAQSPLISKNALARSVLSRAGFMAFEAIGRIAKLQPRARTFVLRAFLDQYPNPDNRVTLSDDVDLFGARRANVTWKFTDDDKDSLLSFLGALKAAFSSADLGNLDFSGLIKNRDWPITALHSHFMGTTRMGQSPRTGVVDRDCKVFGCSNLFVVGPSVFSAYGYANPFYTIAALALRLADSLAKNP